MPKIVFNKTIKKKTVLFFCRREYVLKVRNPKMNFSFQF